MNPSPDKHREGLRDLLQEEVSNVTKRLLNSWQALVALTPSGEEPVHGMEIQVMREAKVLIEDLYGIVSRAALSHEPAPAAACSKCGKTPPFPGGTRCQDLQCPLIPWAQSAIESPTPPTLLIEFYEGIVREMRTYGKVIPQVKDWVDRIDLARDEALRAGVAGVTPDGTAKP